MLLQQITIPLVPCVLRCSRTIELLVLDTLRHSDFDELIVERHRKASTIITSNQGRRERDRGLTADAPRLPPRRERLR